MFFDWFEFMVWLAIATISGGVIGIVLTMFLYWRQRDLSIMDFLWEHKILVLFPAFAFFCVASYSYISTTTFRVAPKQSATENIQN